MRLIEKSKFPRHKVCGEFFSPEIETELGRMGLWPAFLEAGPAPVRRLKLNFGGREKTARLEESAWGLSRYAFDSLLLQRAMAEGAERTSQADGMVRIRACGRQISASPRGRRLFGFKAHFEGPADDAVELYFFGRCYVGINPVEGGRSNVCGLGPEDVLRRLNFDFDETVRQSPAVGERLRPLRRSMEWLSTGPLEFRQNFTIFDDNFPAGDALSFIDPFTGTGLVSAVKTGALAGRAVAHGVPVEGYLRECRASLKRPFVVAEIFRSALVSGWAETLAPLLPSRLLFSLTRPQFGGK